MIHWLKTDPSYFQLVWDGKKSFEIRLNDRAYKTDDLLILADGTSDGQAYRAIVARVESVVEFNGLVEGYVALGLTVLGTLDSSEESGLELFKYSKQTITCEEWSSRKPIEIGKCS